MNGNENLMKRNATEAQKRRKRLEEYKPAFPYTHGDLIERQKKHMFQVLHTDLQETIKQNEVDRYEQRRLRQEEAEKNRAELLLSFKKETDMVA
jgi:hypothetical protein